MKKIGSISLIRALAILSVVLIHSLPNQNITELNIFSMRIFTFIGSLMRWSVPGFVMITGALLLPRHESFGKCLSRAGRILVVLLIFGFAMALSQNVFETGFSWRTILLSLKDVISGNTWDLMWYLYMLTGIYLFMPVMSAFVKNAEKRDIQYVLILLFVFTSVIETVNVFYNHAIGFYLPVSSVYLFYLLAGYYIYTYRPKIDRRIIYGILAALAVFYAVICYRFARLAAVENIIGYKSPVTALFTLCIFSILVDIKGCCKALDLISENAFGMFLTHCFYIHLMDRVLGVYSLPYSKLALIIPVYVTAVSASLLTSMALRKIPFVKKLI